MFNDTLNGNTEETPKSEDEDTQIQLLFPIVGAFGALISLLFIYPAIIKVRQSKLRNVFINHAPTLLVSIGTGK